MKVLFFGEIEITQFTSKGRVFLAQEKSPNETGETAISQGKG